MINIREATKEDFDHIWPVFQNIVAEQNAYAFAPDINKQEAFAIWMERPLKTFVAEEDGVILGSYYIVANKAGPGGHVSNCGYMVSEQARGRGIAAQMCEHSQAFAVKAGFKAMQFNMVVSTNEPAVALWKKLGFDIVGTLPKSFKHIDHGYVDAYVMYKWLAE